jgi:hypothetical protein
VVSEPGLSEARRAEVAALAVFLAGVTATVILAGALVAFILSDQMSGAVGVGPFLGWHASNAFHAFRYWKTVKP